MNAQECKLPRAALAVVLTLLACARAAAEEPQAGQAAAPPRTSQAAAPPQAGQAAAQLQRNIHDIRLIIDRERGQLDGALRGNAGQLIVESRDAPSIGRMREQLAQSLERLENRCFGIDVNVTDGNAILICGNNNGTADSANVTTSAHTTVVVAPPPSPAAQPEPGRSGQPASGQPSAGQPAASQPPAGQPAAGQPAGGQPAAGQPTGGSPAKSTGGQP